MWKCPLQRDITEEEKQALIEVLTGLDEAETH